MRRFDIVECPWCKEIFNWKKHDTCPHCKDKYQCVSCGAPTKNTWCSFCLEEE